MLKMLEVLKMGGCRDPAGQGRFRGRGQISTAPARSWSRWPSRIRPSPGRFSRSRNIPTCGSTPAARRSRPTTTRAGRCRCRWVSSAIRSRTPSKPSSKRWAKSRIRRLPAQARARPILVLDPRVNASYAGRLRPAEGRQSRGLADESRG